MGYIMNITVAVERLAYSIMIFTLLVHVLSCIWIYAANESFSEDRKSWLWNDEFRGLDRSEQYILATYFTITTITTVGYGDISATTSIERVLSIFTMIIGVVTFSYATGSLSSILATVDQQSADTLAKITTLESIK
jgi:hypothetical protein